MGTHYAQAGTATNRELDIFAVKQMAVQVDGKSLTCQLRALISVRGFPPTMSPIAYSTADSLQKLNINLLGSYEGPRDNYTQAVRDLLIYLGGLGAQQLLRSASLISSRPLLSFDTIKRVDSHKDSVPPKYERIGEGDRKIFTALDSAVNAAIYWSQDAQQDNWGQGNILTLNIPVCILSLPFWNVCIDEETPIAPELCHQGYQSLAYPGTPNPRLVTTFVWSAETIDGLVSTLDSFLWWFHSELLGGQASMILRSMF